MWLGSAQIRTAINGFMAIARASGLFISTCTIQQPDGTFNEGAPSGEYVDVDGLTNIACMIAPVSPPLAKEEKNAVGGIASTSASATLSVAPYHVLLDDYYNDVEITEGVDLGEVGPQTNMVAVIDGVRYDILGVEPDSQRTQTRMSVRLASV